MCLPKFLGGMLFWRENLGKWGRWVIFAVTNYTIIVRDCVV